MNESRPTRPLSDRIEAPEKGFQWQSKLPAHSWQEHMGLYKIGDQYGAEDLREIAYDELWNGVESVMQSPSALEFVDKLHDLPDGTVGGLIHEAMIKASLDASYMTALKSAFMGFTIRHPDFAHYLICSKDGLLK
jgi:hypothetical protein